MVIETKTHGLGYRAEQIKYSWRELKVCEMGATFETISLNVAQRQKYIKKNKAEQVRDMEARMRRC